MLFYYLIFAYILGSIPFGKLISKYLYRIDIQKRGSGNIGFANVRRVLGWKAGIATLMADILKGAIPTLLALLALDQQQTFLVGLIAITGHIFPVWLGFRGGKGIATGLGVVSILSPVAAFIGSLVYCTLLLLKQKSSTASLVALVSLCILATILRPESWWWYVILLLIALYTLRNNIMGRIPHYG